MHTKRKERLSFRETSKLVLIIVLLSVHHFSILSVVFVRDWRTLSTPILPTCLITTALHPVIVLTPVVFSYRDWSWYLVALNLTNDRKCISDTRNTNLCSVGSRFKSIRFVQLVKGVTPSLIFVMWSRVPRLPPAGSCNNTCPTEGTRTEREWKLLKAENNTRPSLCLQTEFRTLPQWEEIDSMSWLVQSHEALLFPPQVVIARSGQPVEGAAGTRRDRSPF